ncbi:MAG: hypothetical protein KGS72_02585 [Cyanobacteria bacterium REEB67]|nr:hypothetical protein [Cyanobacteria bacterium REEB67]
MYRPKRYVRLNQLPRMPRLADVKNLFEEGKKARSCTVEMPWRTEKLGMTFSLTVRVDLGASEPIWTLYEGEGNRSRVMWSTGFADVDLLYDVLTLSLPSDGPNIFAPPVEEAPPVKPTVPVENQSTYYDSEAYRRQAKEFGGGSSFASAATGSAGPAGSETNLPKSPFLSDDDPFMKPEQSTFQSFARGGNKGEFAPSAVPSQFSDSSASTPALSDQAADVSRQAPAPTADMINPLAEPQIALGAQHQQNSLNTGSYDSTGAAGQPQYQTGQFPAPAYADPGLQQASTQSGAYPVPASAPYPGGPNPPYPPQGYNQYPGGPGQPASPPAYPPNYPGYPPGYAPPPGYPGASGQYPQLQQPNFPGQYPPAYPPYGYPPQGMPGQGGDPLMSAGTLPVGAGMPGSLPVVPGMPLPGQDPYAMPMMAPNMAHKKPAVMLGSLLVEAGLVPKLTIDSALQVQVLVSQGTLSPVKAAEAVRRAHLRGGAVEPEITPPKPNEVVVKIKPQIGQVLVMAGIITAVQLKAALYLQDVMRGGTMTMEEAVELLRREATSAQVKSQSAEQIKAPVAEDLTAAIALTKQAGLVTDSDLEAANKVKEKHGGEISKILMVAGKLDDLTLDAAKNCQRFVDAGKLRVDQAIMALHYCQRMRVPFEEAASELGFDID